MAMLSINLNNPGNAVFNVYEKGTREYDCHCTSDLKKNKYSKKITLSDSTAIKSLVPIKKVVRIFETAN